MTTVSVIVLAAGSAERFGEAKQFLEVAPNIRLVDDAVDTALAVTDSVVVVLPPGLTWDGRDVAATIPGGSTRLDSVAAGLVAIPPDTEVVVVHDAAHPLASAEMFHDLIAAISAGADAAVPMLPLADVVKRTEDDGRLATVGRDDLGMAQVPMAFAAGALRSAHAGGAAHQWEDSMLIEESGGRVVAVEGSSWNIHVVTGEDLAMARILRAARESGGDHGLP